MEVEELEVTDFTITGVRRNADGSQVLLATITTAESGDESVTFGIDRRVSA